VCVFVGGGIRHDWCQRCDGVLWDREGGKEGGKVKNTVAVAVTLLRFEHKQIGGWGRRAIL